MSSLRFLPCALLFVASFPACFPADHGDATFQVRESINQIQVTHATPGASLALSQNGGATIATGVADANGSYLFREVPAGDNYQIFSAQHHTRKFTVKSVDNSLPPQSFYDNQKLKAGFQYITMRDGTTLSAYVTLPGADADGPFPTVVSYSGYAPSKPGEPVNNGQFSALCNELPVLCDAPNDPGALIAALFGYATVSVNIRGTGCSGGAFDYFETLQLLDGYDVIETVAAQSWVKGHKVGMVGLSYPGITQLFVAKMQPPSLAAITPLSVIGNSATTLKPGGILNNGFAISWVDGVISKAIPYGQGWEKARVDGGDLTCQENQLLHSQLIDNVAQAKMLQFYDPALHDKYNPSSFADQIKVPVFLCGSFQDEQTGPFFTTLLDKMTNAPGKRFTVYNGVHPDGFAPENLSEWFAFLEIFVAERIPQKKPALVNLSPLLFQEIFRAELTLVDSKYTDATDYASVKAKWLADPSLHVVFERGGVPGNLGAPIGTFTRDFAAWPPPETQPERRYFAPDGLLALTAPTVSDAASSFVPDPGAGERGILAPGGYIWDLLPDYAWPQLEPGGAVAFVSEPLATTTTMVGTGSVDIWLKSTDTDADLEVNLSEVRPDGQEMYIQSGWLRASYRHLGADSTAMFPSSTYTQKDWQPLVPGQWVEARIPIPGFAHVFRPGSRIKVSIDTPGDSRAEWRFELLSTTPATRHTIGHDAVHPSSVLLPVVPNVDVPSPLPPCPSLRAQECRDYVPFTNTP